jgi:two-component system, cell cycle sensor histidine kinase and response regulator CckA
MDEVLDPTSADRERLYHALFDGANDGIIVHDLDGRILNVNQVVADRIGCSHDGLLAMDLRDVRTPEAAHRFAEQMEKIARQGSAVFETGHRGRDGETVPVEVSSRMLDGRDPRTILSISRDISERKISEQALRASQAKLETAMELADLVDWELDVETGIFTFNDRFYALYGTTAEREGGYQMTADTYAERFVHPDERHLVAEEVGGVTQTTNPGYRGYVEHRIVRPDGEVRHVAVRHVVIKDEQGRTVKTQGANQDITQRKRREEALALAEVQARQSQKMEAVGQLAGGIAHDFNNLLTVVTGNCDLVLGTLSAGDPNRELVAEIKGVGERAVALTRQILAFSRRQTLKPEVVCLNEIVDGMEHLLRRIVGDQIGVAICLSPRLKPIKVDPGQFEQVLMNLAVNARDATLPGGHLTIETTNVKAGRALCKSHAGLKLGSYVLLRVSDDGCGMDKETQTRIFEPFFTTKEFGKGTGLGLSTVYGIVKQSDGYIYVRSEPANGTTFSIYLPTWQ